jgi:hypothetical protein
MVALNVGASKGRIEMTKAEMMNVINVLGEAGEELRIENEKLQAETSELASDRYRLQQIIDSKENVKPDAPTRKFKIVADFLCEVVEGGCISCECKGNICPGSSACVSIGLGLEKMPHTYSIFDGRVVFTEDDITSKMNRLITVGDLIK